MRLTADSAQDTARPARLVIYEREGRWAAALGRHLDVAMRAQNVRSLEECAAALDEAPSSIFCLEMTTASAPKLLEHVVCWRQRYPKARFIALVPRGMVDWSFAMLEAGVTLLVHSTRELSPAAATIRRHLETTGQGQESLDARIWRSLPWSDASPAAEPL